jgi:NAD-dependent dihydropyrimidine dehydrogenase PreA subunit
VRTSDLDAAAALALGAPGEDCGDRGDASAILKDEDRCIRCALCAMRCPTDAITMERVAFQTTWRSS